MGVRYVGGEPTRITSYSQRKNIDRWMCRPKPKRNWPSLEDVLCYVSCAGSIVAIIVFILVCFR